MPQIKSLISVLYIPVETTKCFKYEIKALLLNFVVLLVSSCMNGRAANVPNYLNVPKWFKHFKHKTICLIFKLGKGHFR